jgi:hypothetical protein
MRTGYWVGANIVAVLLYLYFSSRTWLEPELRGEVVASSGDAFIWAMSALPVFVLAVLLDLAVVFWAARRRRQSAKWPFANWSWVIPALWVAAYAIEIYHH